MIAKELEPLVYEDKFRQAGHEAERQMAFYLKRAFAEDQVIRVFNNIRLQRKEEAAQIDHLVLHRYGVIVIESKSIAGQVSVNEHGEWTRWWNGRGRGMPSPILQGKRQFDLLVHLFEDHAPQLLEKVLFGMLQKRFGSMSFDVLVAISDNGRITRKCDVPEVCKADQVTERVRALIDTVRRNSFKNAGYHFTDTELARLTAFLRAQHLSAPQDQSKRAEQREPEQPAVLFNPQGAVPTDFPQPREAESTPQPDCRACKSTNLEIVYGKYGYYFKCMACQANTPLSIICPGCSAKQKVRKSRLQFFVECPPCDRSSLYYTNPEPSSLSSR